MHSQFSSIVWWRRAMAYSLPYPTIRKYHMAHLNTNIEHCFCMCSHPIASHFQDGRVTQRHVWFWPVSFLQTCRQKGHHITSKSKPLSSLHHHYHTAQHYINSSFHRVTRAKRRDACNCRERALNRTVLHAPPATSMQSLICRSLVLCFRENSLSVREKKPEVLQSR